MVPGVECVSNKTYRLYLRNVPPTVIVTKFQRSLKVKQYTVQTGKLVSRKFKEEESGEKEEGEGPRR